LEHQSLHLRIEGYEGPLALLLELARSQKVDIAKVSIIGLVNRFLEVIEGARKVRLEIAAEWLVMAAWLAWLKSRLLVPQEEEPDEDAEDAAARLTERLIELERVRALAAWLSERPQLGHNIFARGAPEPLVSEDRSLLAADLPKLLQAYMAIRQRALARRPYRPKLRRLFTVQNAIERLQRMMTTVPSWGELRAFVPEGIEDSVEGRAALASTLIASLEMAKGGALEIRQEEAFGPILLRPVRSPRHNATAGDAA
jgi:segregation and condensation protein A